MSRATFFSTQNNCCKFLASYDFIFQSDIQSYFKTPVCGASLSYVENIYWINSLIAAKLNIFFSIESKDSV